MAQCRHPDGCPKHSSAGRGGWCSMHYTRIREHGEPGPSGPLRQKNQGKPCAVVGCTEDNGEGAKVKGFCMFHYHRWNRDGDPGSPSRVTYQQPQCVDCGGPKSAHCADRCWDCYQATKSDLNENRICPKCGGDKSWEASVCHDCRWDQYDRVHDPHCVDCGVVLASRTKTRCWVCYRNHKGYLTTDALCSWPGCSEYVGKRGARGKCRSHYAEWRNRMKILKSDRPFKVGLTIVTSHSFRDREVGFSINSRRLTYTIKKRLLRKQFGKCVFHQWCGASVDTITNNPSEWHLDHDHACVFHDSRRMCAKCIRGVLCPRCNMQTVGAIEKAANGEIVKLARAIAEYVA